MYIPNFIYLYSISLSVKCIFGQTWNEIVENKDLYRDKDEFWNFLITISSHFLTSKRKCELQTARQTDIRTKWNMPNLGRMTNVRTTGDSSHRIQSLNNKYINHNIYVEHLYKICNDVIYFLYIASTILIIYYRVTMYLVKSDLYSVQSLFTWYQKNTAMFIWSGCIVNAKWKTLTYSLGLCRWLVSGSPPWSRSPTAPWTPPAARPPDMGLPTLISGVNISPKNTFILPDEDIFLGIWRY